MQDLINAIRRVREIAEKYPRILNVEFDTFHGMSIHLSGDSDFEPLLKGEIAPYVDEYNKQAITIDGVEIFRLIPKEEHHVS